MRPPKAGSALRLAPGLLRSPFRSRFTPRLSETAKPVRGAGGWIDDALRHQGEAETDEGRIGEVVNGIVRGRVGGTFWAPPALWARPIEVAVKADTPSALAASLSVARRSFASKQLGVLLPRRPWAAGARRKLQAQGYDVLLGARDPWSVLDAVRAVVADAEDDLALLALLAGREIHCAAPGWLSGWGLTVDEPGAPRKGRRQVCQAASAALLDGVRYLDPFSGRVTGCEQTLDLLTDWRRLHDEDRDLVALAGVAWWKRRRLKRFVWSPAPFVRDAAVCVALAAKRQGAIGVWPSAAATGLAPAARQAGVALRRIEDGFIRSTGLGSDLLPPSSIVIDKLGIYYDPASPSDLERILEGTTFTPQLRRRARALIDRLLAKGLTKYNTGGASFRRPVQGRLVLVAGQVEDDQSWLLGGAGCQGNLDLVRRVRAEEPGAFILYRPHPDVEAGNRLGAVPDADLLRHADAIDRTSSMPSLLPEVDAVHVLTSLAGFEALLRGREVVVHGQPFYAGWGLTRDLAPVERRGRPLSLEELIAGALILYPRYLDPLTGLPCPPEVLVERLSVAKGDAHWQVRALRELRRRFEPGRPAPLRAGGGLGRPGAPHLGKQASRA